MINFKINSIEVTAQDNQNILQVARQAGIEIPSMCFYEGFPHFTSCMICLVKNTNTGELIPACSVKPVVGMEILTNDIEIHEARRKSLELLLSDHVGECEAPCSVACPSHMDIPGMNRLLAKGRVNEALILVRETIVLPSVLGRICPAPCEAVCRRKHIDNPVSICLLKRMAGDHGHVQIKKSEIESKFKVAVIGAGPAGLSAAFYIRSNGIDCTIFDENELPGGKLQSAISEDLLPKEILSKEITLIKDAGVRFRMNTRIDPSVFDEFLVYYDALILAVGKNAEILQQIGIELSGKGAKVNRNNYQSNIPKVFVVGNAYRPSKMAIRSVAQGKEVAESVSQFLKGRNITGAVKKFNSRFGKLMQNEFTEYLKEASENARLQAIEGLAAGYTMEESKAEAARCMHCDCRKPDTCRLRDYADKYMADQKKYKYGQRKNIRKITHHDLIVYEPEKCIKCSICIRLTEKHKERLGLAFIGRGFDVQIAVPFNESFEQGLEKVAIEVAGACPTGAMAIK